MSRAKFGPSNDGHVYTRDYLGVSIWDVRMTQLPCQTFNVNDYQEQQLLERYENESIYDNFDLQVSPDGKKVLTGGYRSEAHVIDFERRVNTTIKVHHMERRSMLAGVDRKYQGIRVIGSLT